MERAEGHCRSFAIVNHSDTHASAQTSALLLSELKHELTADDCQYKGRELFGGIGGSLFRAVSK